MTDRFGRFGISLIALGALALFAALRMGAPSAYAAVLTLFDIPRLPVTFSDLGAVAQAVHCAGQGVNVYVANACMGGGIYNYSRLLLHFGGIGALTGHLGAAGLGLALLFIAALAALPSPRSRVEFWLRALGSVSVSVVFALERANLDAVVFLLALGGILLMRRCIVARLAGYALFCVAAALKYYPVALLVLALREAPRRLVLLAALGVAALAAFLARFGAGTLAALAVVPHGPPFGNCFGAIDIPLGLGIGIAAVHGATADALMNYQMTLPLHLAYVAMILAALWRGWRNAPLYQAGFTTIEDEARVPLIGGAALITACFFMAQNIDYRAIFLLLALPGAFALRRVGVGRGGVLGIAMVALLWESFFRITALSVMKHLAGPVAGYSAAIMVWLGREVLWWWVVTQFLALLICQARAALARIRA